MSFVLSLLNLGAFLGCVHEHVNSLKAEMNSCDFYRKLEYMRLDEKMIFTDHSPAKHL